MLVILIQKPMPTVRIQMQVSIGIHQPLPQDVAILRVDEEIVGAVGDQDRDLDLVQPVIGALVAMVFGDETLDGGDLVLHACRAEQWGAIGTGLRHALPPLLRDILLLVRVREEGPFQRRARLLLGGRHGHLRGILWRRRDHALAYAGSGPGDDELPDEIRCLQHHELDDEAAHGKAKDVDLVDPQGSDDVDHDRGPARVFRGHLAFAASDACAVDEEDGPFLRQSVDEGWVPVVHVASEVRMQEQWHPWACPKRR